MTDDDSHRTHKVSDHVDNRRAQLEELESLVAIFGEEKVQLDCSGSDFGCTLRLDADDSTGSDNTALLFVTLPGGYPSHEIPHCVIQAPHLKTRAKTQFENVLMRKAQECSGACVLFDWMETAREFLSEDKEGVEDTDDSDLPDCSSSGDVASQSDMNLQIVSGEPLLDRRSTFQAHVAPVMSKGEVEAVLSELKSNKKIAAATHNIYAYRFSDPQNGLLVHDCYDDGEKHAGPGLARLLQISGASDVLVVVTRWYGGVHLGPDRFRHINERARTLLKQEGYIDDGTTGPKGSTSAEKRKRDRDKYSHGRKT